MSTYHSGTMGVGAGGVGEAYPVTDESSQPVHMRGGGGGVERHDGGGGDHASALDETSHSEFSARSRFSRAIYDDAQSRASSRTGSVLYQSGMSTSRRSRPSMDGSGSYAQHSAGYSGSGGSGGGASYFPSMQPRPVQRGVSLSGNLMLHVRIEEDPDVELDRDEIKLLAGNVKANEAAAAQEAAQMQMLGDASTIGTTVSTFSKLSNSNSNVIVHGNPNEAILSHGAPLTDIDQARKKMKEFIFSPPFRRTLFLSICFILIGLGVLLTMENFMSVKTARDWMEPHRNKYSVYNEGGIDWTFGSDAPKPMVGASIDYAVENNIADWAHGTSRISSASGLDGFGSVALSETVMFKDVPLFWGLPFAGGSIMESVLGQCLGFVQASDGKGMDDGRGDELHLSTVMLMGKKYLNVDLSTIEGIGRASALALGTSGMADVVYSPLLHEVSELFSTMNQGRLFVMVRHPVEREFARFRYMLKWDHGKLVKDEDKGFTYEEFARSDYVADNWMTRTLVRKAEDEELTAQDMRTAKEILRRKALVGLYSDIIGATRHYARYFGWDNASKGGKLNKATLSCFENKILEGMKKDTYVASMNLAPEDAKEGSVAWRTIMDKNRFDFELYAYSQQLYKFQIALS